MTSDAIASLISVLVGEAQQKLEYDTVVECATAIIGYLQLSAQYPGRKEYRDALVAGLKELAAVAARQRQIELGDDLLGIASLLESLA
jgi:hypothetical protein